MKRHSAMFGLDERLLHMLIGRKAQWLLLLWAFSWAFKGWCWFQCAPVSYGASCPAASNSSNSGVIPSTESWTRLSAGFGGLLASLNVEMAVVLECRAFTSLAYHSPLTGGSSARRINSWLRVIWGMILVMLVRKHERKGFWKVYL